MMTFLLVATIFSLLIIVHEWGHFYVARKSGVRVERFSVGFGPRVWARQIGDTEYCLSAFPLGGYVKMAGEEPGEARSGAADEYASQSVLRRFGIVFAGPAVNYIVAWVAFVLVCILGLPALSPTIGNVLPDTPAAVSGLQAEDHIVAISGVIMATWDDVTEHIHAHPGQAVEMVIERNGEQLVKTVVPKSEVVENLFGETHTVGLIGILPTGEHTILHFSVGESIMEGTQRLLLLSWYTLKSLGAVFTGGISMKDSLTGPIGVFVLTGEAAAMGFVYLIHMVAVLSMSLAIFNVLPIPVLDGGHLFFLLIEGIRRKPVSLKIQMWAAQAGMALLLMLMVVVFYSDFDKFGITTKVKSLWQQSPAQMQDDTR
jgi:regulator of sigma E protease